jgi:thiamine phosphate synthase YjbQ (UPF0047 family)
MSSIEVPYSIAAALPTLSVMDITNEVSQTIARSGCTDGIAYVHAARGLSLVRVQERETGIFEDIEMLLERVVPGGAAGRERLVAAGRLCMGKWQRILLFSLDAEHQTDWSITLLG